MKLSDSVNTNDGMKIFDCEKMRDLEKLFDGVNFSDDAKLLDGIKLSDAVNLLDGVKLLVGRQSACLLKSLPEPHRPPQSIRSGNEKTVIELTTVTYLSLLLESEILLPLPLNAGFVPQ